MLLFNLWIGVVGLAIGSFLNVVIARLPGGLSIVRPRSRCPNCGRQLTWQENVPVLSWLALRGRCQGCRAPISIRYPLVELLTGALFYASAAAFGLSWELLAAIMLIGFLIPLTFIDLDHWLLPNELTFPGVAVGLLVSLPLGWPRVRDAAIGAAAGYLAFWALEWIGEKVFRKEALGGGDKNLLALIGAFLTYKSLPAVIFLSSLQGSIVGIALLAARGRAGPSWSEEERAAAAERKRRNAEKGPEEELEDDWVPGATNMPFGPWLAVAAVEVLLVGGLLAERLPWPTSVLIGGAR